MPNRRRSQFLIPTISFVHREINTADEPFRSETPLGLYALTALLGGLLAADLWPIAGNWLKSQNL